MRSWTWALAATLVACAGQTQAGPVGQPLELRHYLPDSLRSATAATADSIFRQEIHIGPDSARVELTWTTFQHSSGRYLASFSARLMAPVRYDSVTVGNISALQNSGTKVQPVESAKTEIRWFKRTMFAHKVGATDFEFGADGRRMSVPRNAP